MGERGDDMSDRICKTDVLPPVLDACCGSRMFWFDKADDRAVFVDKRREHHTLPDASSTGGSRELVIDPDVQAEPCSNMSQHISK